MYENWAVYFNGKKQSFCHSWIEEPDKKAKENSGGFYAAFFTTVFRVVGKLCAVFKFIFAEKKLLNPVQVALTKILRNEAKIYQETDFLNTEGHLLTSSDCFPTLTSSLDVAQVRFAFAAFCLWTI